MKARHIGTYTVTEPTTFRRADYPTASWWKKIEVAPGTYDVFATLSPAGFVDRVSVKLTGTVVDAYFPSSFAGNIHTDGKRPQEIGRTDSLHLGLYGFSFADALDDEDTPWALDDEGWEYGDDGRLYTAGPDRVWWTIRAGGAIVEASTQDRDEARRNYAIADEYYEGEATLRVSDEPVAR